MNRRITAVRMTAIILKHQPSPEVVVVKADGEECLRLEPEEAAQLQDALGWCNLDDDALDLLWRCCGFIPPSPGGLLEEVMEFLKKRGALPPRKPKGA